MSDTLQAQSTLHHVGHPERLDMSVSLFVSPSMAAALEKAARTQDRTLSWYIRSALSEKLTRDGLLGHTMGNGSNGVAP